MRANMSATVYSDGIPGPWRPGTEAMERVATVPRCDPKEREDECRLATTQSRRARAVGSSRRLLAGGCERGHGGPWCCRLRCSRSLRCSSALEQARSASEGGSEEEAAPMSALQAKRRRAPGTDRDEEGPNAKRRSRRRANGAKPTALRRPNIRGAKRVQNESRPRVHGDVQFSCTGATWKFTNLSCRQQHRHPGRPDLRG